MVTKIEIIILWAWHRRRHHWHHPKGDPVTVPEHPQSRYATFLSLMLFGLCSDQPVLWITFHHSPAL